MRLLVTGGAGYIGSIVAQQLLAGGHEVVVLDSLERGHRDAVPEGARLLEVDLRDAGAVRDAVAEGFDGKEISERLHISLRTERNHMASILAKFGVNSRLQALVFALRHGVVNVVDRPSVPDANHNGR